MEDSETELESLDNIDKLLERVLLPNLVDGSTLSPVTFAETTVTFCKIVHIQKRN
jgi:hypothetical protein